MFTVCTSDILKSFNDMFHAEKTAWLRAEKGLVNLGKERIPMRLKLSEWQEPQERDGVGEGVRGKFMYWLLHVFCFLIFKKFYFRSGVHVQVFFFFSSNNSVLCNGGYWVSGVLITQIVNILYNKSFFNSPRFNPPCFGSPQCPLFPSLWLCVPPVISHLKVRTSTNYWLYIM